MKNNKGMAFVSVMIAILFIGLLATSLCFMAYNNHMTKTTRWGAENNFYYDEFAVDELSSAMRQKARVLGDIAYNSDPSTHDRFQEFVIALASETGVSGETGNMSSSHSGTWVKENMQSLLEVSDDNANLDIEVFYSSRGPASYVRTGTDIVFKNVGIKFTDKSNGYTTSIVTDIRIPGDQPPAAAGTPVNDFSLMNDGPITWDKGGTVQMYGNFFCMDNPASSNHTGTALELKSGGQMYINGKKSLIVGNVVVNSGSVLVLANEVTITGTLTINGSGRVECRGNSVLVGDVQGSGTISGKYQKDNTLTANANSIFKPGTNYSEGLASAICDDVSIITGTTVNADGITVSNSDLVLSKATDTKTNDSSLGALASKNNGNTMKEASNSAYSSDCSVYFRAGSDNINGDDVNKTLAFLPGNNQQIRGEMLTATIIGPSGLAMGSDDNFNAPNIGKLPQADYEACLNTMWTTTDGWGSAPSLIAGNKADFDAIVKGFKDAKRLDDLDSQTTGTKVTTRQAAYAYVVESMPNKAGAERYKVYRKSDGASMVPWGYFIREDADDIIGFAFSSVRGVNSSVSGRYDVVYENWSKE